SHRRRSFIAWSPFSLSTVRRHYNNLSDRFKVFPPPEGRLLMSPLLCNSRRLPSLSPCWRFGLILLLVFAAGCNMNVQEPAPASGDYLFCFWNTENFFDG